MRHVCPGSSLASAGAAASIAASAFMSSGRGNDRFGASTLSPRKPSDPAALSLRRISSFAARQLSALGGHSSRWKYGHVELPTLDSRRRALFNALKLSLLEFADEIRRQNRSRFHSGSPEWTVFTIIRNERTLLRIVAGRCAALAWYRSISSPMVA